MGAEESVDADLAQWLNLLNTSRQFVLIEGTSSEEPRLQQFDVVPAETGLVWLAAELRLANGSVLDAVVQADARIGELHGVYVLKDQAWHALTKASIGDVLELEPSAAYPFDYEFAVPLESDHYR